MNFVPFFCCLPLMMLSRSGQSYIIYKSLKSVLNIFLQLILNKKIYLNSCKNNLNFPNFELPFQDRYNPFSISTVKACRCKTMKCIEIEWCKFFIKFPFFISFVLVRKKKHHCKCKVSLARGSIEQVLFDIPIFIEADFSPTTQFYISRKNK